jgi:hypothetical protein
LFAQVPAVLPMFAAASVAAPAVVAWAGAAKLNAAAQLATITASAGNNMRLNKTSSRQNAPRDRTSPCALQVYRRTALFNRSGRL